MAPPLSPRWVDSADGVAEVAAACRRAGRFALDTEADSLHSYFHKVCLIQVTADDITWLVDPLALTRDDLAPLLEVVSDPATTVLMHGADYDIRVLDRDFATTVGGLEDTQIMAQVLGEPKTGLAALYEQELDIKLSKKLQRADWGLRPLPEGHRQYAAADTAHLGRLADRLEARVRELERWHWVEEECARLMEVRHTPSEPDPLDFERVKGARKLTGAARDRLFTLHRWREEQARSKDIPPFKILGNRPMISLADKPPEGPDAMARLDGVGPRFVRRWGRQVHRCLASPERAPKPQLRTDHDPGPSAAQRRRAKALSTARDLRAEALGIASGLLCPRALVEAVADRPATDRAQLEEAGLTGWRLEELAEPFLAVLADSP